MKRSPLAAGFAQMLLVIAAMGSVSTLVEPAASALPRVGGPHNAVTAFVSSASGGLWAIHTYDGASRTPRAQLTRRSATDETGPADVPGLGASDFGLRHCRKGSNARDPGGWPGHVFRDAPVHLSDSPANRKLLQGVADDPATTLGADKFGNTWSARTLDETAARPGRRRATETSSTEA
jgi:hypothetical protein